MSWSEIYMLSKGLSDFYELLSHIYFFSFLLTFWFRKVLFFFCSSFSRIDWDDGIKFFPSSWHYLCWCFSCFNSFLWYKLSRNSFFSFLSKGSTTLPVSFISSIYLGVSTLPLFNLETKDLRCWSVNLCAYTPETLCLLLDPSSTAFICPAITSLLFCSFEVSEGNLCRISFILVFISRDRCSESPFMLKILYEGFSYLVDSTFWKIRETVVSNAFLFVRISLLLFLLPASYFCFIFIL